MSNHLTVCHYASLSVRSPFHLIASRRIKSQAQEVGGRGYLPGYY